MHLDEGRIHRLIHDEPDAPGQADARAHADQCEQCRARIADARREDEDIAALLRRIDHPAPPTTANTVIARATARPSRAPLRRAAGILLVLGAAGAAYAAPGSPVPGWVEAVSERFAAEEPAPAPAPQATRPGGGGVSVDPGVRLVIDFAGAPAGATALVTLTDAAEVTVRAVTGEARFNSDPDGGLRVDAGTADSFQIDIPRTAPLVEIRAGERRVLRKIGDSLTGGAAEGGGWRVRVGG